MLLLSWEYVIAASNHHEGGVKRDTIRVYDTVLVRRLLVPANVGAVQRDGWLGSHHALIMTVHDTNADSTVAKLTVLMCQCSCQSSLVRVWRRAAPQGWNEEISYYAMNLTSWHARTTQCSETGC